MDEGNGMRRKYQVGDTLDGTACAKERVDVVCKTLVSGLYANIDL